MLEAFFFASEAKGGLKSWKWHTGLEYDELHPRRVALCIGRCLFLLGFFVVAEEGVDESKGVVRA